jgi:mannose-6-phosphate isomerase-like protein (cupin superfamily)
MNKNAKKKGYSIDIEDATKENKCFRKVLYTGEYSQLVLMTLRKGEEIGMEVHDDRDQFFRFEEGEGEVIINGNVHKVKDGSAVVVPAGSQHNVVNTGEKKLKLYTIYSPPEHMDKTVRGTKAEAEAQEEHFDGKTTE